MSEQNPRVLMETSKGNITIELFKEKAPISVKNFLGYVADGYYDGLIFHRVINGFMVQGGGMDENMQPKKTKFAIKNEAANGLKNLNGLWQWHALRLLTAPHHSFSSILLIMLFLTTKGKDRKISVMPFSGRLLKGWISLMQSSP